MISFQSQHQQRYQASRSIQLAFLCLDGQPGQFGPRFSGRPEEPRSWNRTTTADVFDVFFSEW